MDILICLRHNANMREWLANGSRVFTCCALTLRLKDQSIPLPCKGRVVSYLARQILRNSLCVQAFDDNRTVSNWVIWPCFHLPTFVGSIADERQQYCRPSSAILPTIVSNRLGSLIFQALSNMQKISWYDFCETNENNENNFSHEWE